MTNPLAEAIAPDLLPCPFCGAAPKEGEFDDHSMAFVECSQHLDGTHSAASYGDTPEQAGTLWNTRVAARTPAAPPREPVAWMYTYPGGVAMVEQHRRSASELAQMKLDWLPPVIEQALYPDAAPKSAAPEQQDSATAAQSIRIRELEGSRDWAISCMSTFTGPSGARSLEWHVRKMIELLPDTSAQPERIDRCVAPQADALKESGDEG